MKGLAIGRVQLSSGTIFREVLDQCVLQFTVPAVPKASAYFLLVGRQPAAAVRYSTLEASGGKTEYDVNPPAVPRTPGGQ